MENITKNSRSSLCISAIKNVNSQDKRKSITLDDVYQQITSENRRIVEKVRCGHASKNYLPCYIFGELADSTSSGLIVLDYDYKTKDGTLLIQDLGVLQDIVESMPETLMSFRSTRGDGLKVVVKVTDVGQTREEFYDTYLSVKEIYDNACGHVAVLDTSGKNRNRLCYISYDHAAYFNPNSQPVKTKVFKKQLVTKDRFSTITYTGADNLYGILEYVQRDGAIGNGHRTTPATSFFGTANLYGHDKDSAVNFLVQNSDITLEQAKYIADDIYTRYSAQHNTKGTKYTLSDYTSQHQNERPTITNHKCCIEIDRYLEEVSNELNSLVEHHSNLTIISPTGSGKSTYVLRHAKGKRILYVPFISIAENIREANKDIPMKVLYNGSGQEYRKGDELLVVVHGNLSKIADIEEYTLFFDECHEILSASYKYSALAEALTLAKKAKKVVFLTGTYITTSIGFLKDSVLVNVARRVEETTQCTIVATDHIITTLLDTILQNPDKKHFVYFNDKKESETIALKLNRCGIKTICVHRENRAEKGVFEVIKSGRMDENQVIISTAILQSGWSLKGEREVWVHILRDTDSVEFVQLINRVRDAKPTVFQYIRTNREFSSAVVNRLAIEQKKLSDINKIVAGAMGYLLTIDDPDKRFEEIKALKTSRNYCDDDGKHLATFHTDSIEVNELAVQQAAYRLHSLCEKVNILFRISNIEPYNVAFSWKTVSISEKTSTSKEREVIAMERLEELSEILSEFEKEGQAYVESLAESGKGADITYIEAAEKINILLNYVCFQDALSIMKEAGLSQRKFKRYVIKLKIQKDRIQLAGKNRSALYRYSNIFTIGNTYTADEIHSLTLAFIQKDWLAKHSKLKKNKTTEIFKNHFTVQEAFRKIDGQTIRFYTVIKAGATDYTIIERSTGLKGYTPFVHTVSVEHTPWHKNDSQSVLEPSEDTMLCL